MSLGTILLVVLIMCLVGAFLPSWRRTQTWGRVVGGLGLALLVVVVVLLLAGRL